VSEPSQQTTPGLRGRVAVVLLVGLAVVAYGGYGGHWAWTGINGHTATLWDWLHLVLLPMAVAMLPLWLSRHTRLDQAGKLIISGLAVVFIVLVIAGYLVPWSWTGFKGNTLWDWLNLLALPVAVALAPVFEELREVWSPRHATIAMVVSAAFGVFVLAAYLLSWHWTGFSGNTLWDWLHLLLLPLLLPTVIVPALRPVASSRVEVVDAPSDARSAGHDRPPGDQSYH
jgi:hypothetical protein